MASVAGMSSPPLSQPGDRAGLFFQAAGCLKRGLALAPGPGPGLASSSERGASSGRPGHPVVARDGPRRVNWRWSRPQHPAHGARTPGRPARATLRHALTSGRPHSAHSMACRAAWRHAPSFLNHVGTPQMAPSSRSKLALISRSVPDQRPLPVNPIGTVEFGQEHRVHLSPDTGPMPEAQVVPAGRAAAAAEFGGQVVPGAARLEDEEDAREDRAVIQRLAAREAEPAWGRGRQQRLEPLPQRIADQGFQSVSSFGEGSANPEGAPGVPVDSCFPDALSGLGTNARGCRRPRGGGGPEPGVKPLEDPRWDPPAWAVFACRTSRTWFDVAMVWFPSSHRDSRLRVLRATGLTVSDGKTSRYK